MKLAMYPLVAFAVVLVALPRKFFNSHELTDRLLLHDLKRSERKVSRYADDDDDFSDCGDMNSIISNSSLLMTPGEPHGREEHQQQRLSPTLEQGCNTYEDITRNVNIGTLVLS